MNGRKKYSETTRFGRVRLMKRADSGVWYLKYHLPDGRWKEESTGTDLKTEAVRHAEERSGQLTNRVLRVPDGTIQLASMFAKYLAAKTQRRKKRTVARIQTTVNNFRAWLSTAMPRATLAKHVTPEVIRLFQTSRRANQDISGRTINNDIRNLNSVFLWACREGYLSKSPADYSRDKGTIDLYEEPDSPPDTYTEDEYHKLLAESKRRGEILIHDMIVVLAGTGMRFGELQHMTPDWLHWDAECPYIDIRACGGWSPKDPKEKKQVPMFPEVAETLRRRSALCNGGYLFANQAGSVPNCNRTRERLQRYFPNVGIDRTTRRLHWHSFRNYFIVRCLLNGATPFEVMSWTGHDTWQLVMQYARAYKLPESLKAFRAVAAKDNERRENSEHGPNTGVPRQDGALGMEPGKPLPFPPPSRDPQSRLAAGEE